MSNTSELELVWHRGQRQYLLPEHRELCRVRLFYKDGSHRVLDECTTAPEEVLQPGTYRIEGASLHVAADAFDDADAESLRVEIVK